MEAKLVDMDQLVVADIMGVVVIMEVVADTEVEECMVVVDMEVEEYTEVVYMEVAYMEVAYMEVELLLL